MPAAGYTPEGQPPKLQTLRALRAAKAVSLQPLIADLTELLHLGEPK